MRVVFMGTPDAAVPSLRVLSDAFDVVSVYTRVDRPRGRGLKLSASAVKAAAVELGLPIAQPRSLRKEVGRLEELRPDAIAVVAYGMLLPPDVLAVPRLGCVNVHFSLLPRWRGAAPVEWALLSGDERTGVTTMLMDVGLDTGPILHQETIEIGAQDTTGSVRDRLAVLGADLVTRTLADLDAGRVEARPQSSEGVTLAPKLHPHSAELDPVNSAVELERRIRTFDPEPGAFLWFRGKRLKIWKATPVAGDGEPGVLASVAPDALDVQTAAGRLRLLEVQPEGKRRMEADAFVRGYRPTVDEPVGPAAKP